MYNQLKWKPKKFLYEFNVVSLTNTDSWLVPRREKPIGGEIPTVLDLTELISADRTTDLTEKAQNADIGHSNDPPDESIRRFLLHSKNLTFYFTFWRPCVRTELNSGRRRVATWPTEILTCASFWKVIEGCWHEGGGEGDKGACMLGGRVRRAMGTAKVAFSPARSK